MKSVVVVGDLMLDTYLEGPVLRMSPEAPVPVVSLATQSWKPGGAANVALGCSAWGSDAVLIGVTGSDEAGLRLKRLVEGQSLSSKIFSVDNYVTTNKTRVVSNGHQIVRVDSEEYSIPRSGLRKLKSTLDSVMGSVIAFSDYSKGAVTGLLRHEPDLISTLRQQGNKVIIDPKGRDFTPYINASIITPNRDEFEVAVGRCDTEEELRQKATNLRRELQLEYLLITRSGDGMTLFGVDLVKDFPALRQEVVDVTGAGDTVVAVLASELAFGTDITEALQLASLAAWQPALPYPKLAALR